MSGYIKNNNLFPASYEMGRILTSSRFQRTAPKGLDNISEGDNYL